MGLDGKYLFVSENPYVQEGRSGRRQEMGRMGEVVAGMEMQYQVSRAEYTSRCRPRRIDQASLTEPPRARSQGA